MTNNLDPKSWNGVTVFGVIALAEALYYHGDLLNENRLKRWTGRLSKAVAFVYKKCSECFGLSQEKYWFSK